MIGIIGAMVPEMEILGAALVGTRRRTAAGMSFLTGTLEGKDVVLLQCGVGKVNAAIGAALLLELFRPSAVLNTGSAGGLLSTQSFGDTLVSTAVVHHDVDVTAFGYAPGQVPGLPATFVSDPALVALAESCLEGIPHTKGLIGSGDVFVHDAEVIARIRSRFPGLCAVEMEAAAIAQACSLTETPFVVVRALSDIAGKESPMKFDEFLPLASKNSSRLVLEMLKRLKIE
jgi:adenosylhomocysteine nucleosidase